MEAIKAFRQPPPALVLLSSAGVERNAFIGDDPVARAQDIPIVQLHPGGVLTWKYFGESAIRYSGLPYAVIRPTGLDRGDEETALLELWQAR